MTSASLISIVEDDDSFRRATARFVNSLGYAVSVFKSAAEFLASGILHDTACLICDVQMPGINGLDLQSRLLTQGHRLPIIFVTAYPNSPARTQALALGAIAFLDKPFNEAELISRIEQALCAGKD